MPKLSPNAVPSYRLHKQSGQAVVTLGGKDILLGTHGSAASKAEYDRRIAEWIANGRRAPEAPKDLSISELIATYRPHIEKYYQYSHEASTIRLALRPLREMYGKTMASEFGPLKLKALRESMIQEKNGRPGWTRRSTNKQINRIRAMFKWAAENEMLPPSVHHGLVAVSALKAGRTDARESDPIKPVPDAFIDAILPHVSPQVKAMIELQLLTAARPGELCIMRTVDIDIAGKVWLYRPATHKTSHHGHSREIRIGPKAQDILRPWLKMDTQAYIFSPAEAERARRATMHAKRKTPLHYGNRPGSNQKRKPKVTPRDRYDVDSYRKAIQRGCDKAFPPPAELDLVKDIDRFKAWQADHRWHPHQLRHNAATRIRREAGIDMARIILGHRSVAVTEIYAEADTAKASMVMEQLG